MSDVFLGFGFSVGSANKKKDNTHAKLEVLKKSESEERITTALYKTSPV